MTPSPSYSPDMLLTLFDPCVHFTLIPHLLRPDPSLSLARPHVNRAQTAFGTHLDLCVTSSIWIIVMFLPDTPFIFCTLFPEVSLCLCIMSPLALPAVSTLIMGLFWDVTTLSYYPFYSFSSPLVFIPTPSKIEEGGDFSHHCYTKHLETAELAGWHKTYSLIECRDAFFSWLTRVF